MSFPYNKNSRQAVPQSQPLDSRQVKNNAGGYVYQVSIWDRLARFLILGSDSNTYYQKATELTRANAECVDACLREDAHRTIAEIVTVSVEGRAPKNSAAIYALAIAASFEGVNQQAVRALALSKLPQVCRIPTHLFEFVEYVTKMRGWGSSLKKAVARWYSEKSVDDLAYAGIKYQQREGWSHRDLLRLSHPEPHTSTQDEVYRFLAAKDNKEVQVSNKILVGFQGIHAAQTAKQAALLISAYKLPREAVPTQFLDSAEVWDALLQDMPYTALIRNLNKITAVGVADSRIKYIVDMLTNEEKIVRAKVHPITILTASKQYGAGRGMLGSLTWSPKRPILDALDQAFIASFKNVVPSGKKLLIGVDCSGSMSMSVNGVLSARDIAAAFAMVIARTELDYDIRSFNGGGYSYGHKQTKAEFPDIAFGARSSLNEIARVMRDTPWGTTDCSIPARWAAENNYKADAIVMITDNETWCGGVHPQVALRDLRQKVGKPVKQIVLATTSTGFTVADPNDKYSMDLVGFDSAVPQLISNFIR